MLETRGLIFPSGLLPNLWEGDEKGGGVLTRRLQRSRGSCSVSARDKCWVCDYRDEGIFVGSGMGKRVKYQKCIQASIILLPLLTIWGGREGEEERVEEDVKVRNVGGVGEGISGENSRLK